MFYIQVHKNKILYRFETYLKINEVQFKEKTMLLYYNADNNKIIPNIFSKRTVNAIYNCRKLHVFANNTFLV